MQEQEPSEAGGVTRTAAHCARCKRLAPDDRSEWEALDDEGHLICPDCLNSIWNDVCLESEEEWDDDELTDRMAEALDEIKPMPGSVSREEALMWLNDWCGKRVMVTSNCGGMENFFTAIGRLGHGTWSNADGSSRVRLGDYDVGDSFGFDIGENGQMLRYFRVRPRDAHVDSMFRRTGAGLGDTLDIGLELEHVEVSVIRLLEGF